MKKKNYIAKWLSKEFNEEIDNKRAFWFTACAISFALVCTIGAANEIAALLTTSLFAFTAYKAKILDIWKSQD